MMFNASLSKSPILLALHSSTESLGVAVLDSRKPIDSRNSATFELVRELSNDLLSCVDQLLPTAEWSKIGRIAVAIGPGGFTGTRLTVILARTLAQQLNCHLDGISSFALMAPRMALKLPEEQRREAFWLSKNLPRRGTLGGKYKLQINQGQKRL